MDPFAVLGVPRRYDLDRRAVESAHLRLLATLHPDRIADPVRRAEASSSMAEANEAKDILLDDERRAEALLALRGGAPRDAERELPPGFLMEVLELREKLDEAMAAEDPAPREEFERMVAIERTAHRDAVAELFSRLATEAGAASGESGALGDPSGRSADESIRRAIRLRLNSWRYIERMRGTLRGAAVE